MTNKDILREYPKLTQTYLNKLRFVSRTRYKRKSKKTGLIIDYEYEYPAYLEKEKDYIYVNGRIHYKKSGINKLAKYK